MDKTEALQLIADVKVKVIALQDAKLAGGMPAVDEEEIKAALVDLSVTADPTVPNPA